MTVTQFLLIIIYGVQFGVCINWQITMFIATDVHSDSSNAFYLDVFGTDNNRHSLNLGSSFEIGEIKDIDVDYNFGKIESVRIFTYGTDGIWLTKLILSDGTRSYTFPCSCWIDGHDSPSYTLIPQECYWNDDVTPNCAEVRQISCQIGECIRCISGYDLEGTRCVLSDPCKLLPTTIPQLEKLRPTNIQPIGPSASLADGWYSGGQYLILTESPVLDSPRCGADSQIWMNGTFPVADGSKHARQLCITDRTSGDTCASTQSVYIENCTTHMMYELTTPPDNSAYCFDIPSDSTDPPPSYRPSMGEIKYELRWNSGLISKNEINSNSNEEPFFRFICDFVRDTSNDYFYVVYFYVDGRYVNLGNDIVVYGNIEAFVTEETLMSKFGYTAGINILCSVGVRSSPNGQTGSLVISEEFYAGMKMLNESVPIERGRSATVYFQQTVPFGCMRTSSWFQNSGDCKLNLHIRKTSRENTCYSNTIQHRGQCDIEVRGETAAVNSDTWKPQIYSFELASVESFRGYFWLITRQFSFQLETSTSHHKFWENSKSDSVQVIVEEGTDDRSWQGKHCRVFCDPHMMSFDGLKYELQYPGSFLLFKSEDPPIQIQVEITSCNRNSRSPYCACGVLVAAGKDVFQIYLCNRPNYLNYKSCLDGVLRVIKRTTKDYEIYLPTGAVVRVWLRSNGLLDVDITPTVHEYRGRISGLCGDFDGDMNNDCVSKGGSLPCLEKPIPNQRPYSYHPNSFTQSYRLNTAENLLNTNIDTDLLPSYPRSHETCSCTNGIHETPQCSARQYGICSNPGKEVICTAIKEISLRKKRQVEIMNNYQHHDIIKRSTVINESEAIQLCTEALNTVTNEACSQIGVNSSSDEIDNCAADLMLTGDGNWTKYAIDRSESLCLETLEKNTTLQKENPEISNIIRNNTCPLNCSERGSCSNGKCVCQNGFASDDCSFDLSKPLQILGLENDGLCDIDEGCSYIVVEGLEFPSDINITCRFSGQATLVEEIGHTMDELNVIADLNTLFAIICELPVIDTPSDRLGIEYNVSVALDGFGFSDPINFVVIDTVCQDYVNNSGKITFHIKDGFCYINGTCYPEGSYKENAICLECRPDDNLYTWSNSSIEDCVVSDRETADTSDDVIIIVISAVTGSLSACLLVCVLCYFCKNKIKRKRISQEPVKNVKMNC
ncbi:von Willebrand factor D and EGF domain-containing protein-like [Argopecten irradians]|uniref:von Willebrand factor D and EGF domain-containing protein-like n=1 Tax=Argopecten irradians TaxID=31199 RepID=UPI0037184B36